MGGIICYFSVTAHSTKEITRDIYIYRTINDYPVDITHRSLKAGRKEYNEYNALEMTSNHVSL